MANIKPVQDHLGNNFPSKAAMLRHYGITYTAFQYRLEKLHMSLEEALTKPHTDDKSAAIVCEDHLGNKFPTKADMCDYWHISRPTFFRRIRDGWDLEKALTHPLILTNPLRKIVKDHKGNEFVTVDEMCKFHNISKRQYMINIRNNCTLEQALTSVTKKEKCKDHLGNEYKSINEMCRAYNTTKTTLRSRIELGWTLREILENPSKKCNYSKAKDHKGQEFNCIKDMCKAYKISEHTFKHRRQQMKMSLEEALTGGNMHIVTCKDHTGREFGSIFEMCLYWNVKMSTYYGRHNKLKWDDKKTLTTIAPSSYKKFGPNLTIVKKVNAEYYEVCFNDETYIWHMDKLFEYYRNTMLYPQSGIKVIKKIDNQYWKVETPKGVCVMKYPEITKRLRLVRPL